MLGPKIRTGHVFPPGPVALLLAIVFGAFIVLLSGCTHRKTTLYVCSGKGLKMPIEDIKTTFMKKYNVKIVVIYGGAKSLLTVIREIKKGDIFIPGSDYAITEAGDLIDSSRYVASHVPVIAVLKDNPRHIGSFDDLARAGVKIAIGNSDMCDIGRTASRIIAKSKLGGRIRKNIIIRAPDSPELLDLVVQKEVDAAIIWRDMMSWPVSKEIKAIELPPELNEIEEVRVAVLTISRHKKIARLFADFVASEGRAVFRRHGFSER